MNFSPAPSISKNSDSANYAITYIFTSELQNYINFVMMGYSVDNNDR